MPRGDDFIGGIFIGASLFALLNGAPQAFLALACCWLAVGVARTISVIVEKRPTRFNLFGFALEIVMAALIALPYLPLSAA